MCIVTAILILAGGFGGSYARWLIKRVKSTFVLLIPAIFVFYYLSNSARQKQEGSTTISSEVSTTRGRCGPYFPLPSGAPSTCSPSAGTCCSEKGWCTFSPDDCLCEDCIYYEWNEVSTMLDVEAVLYDDNSKLQLAGYTTFNILPQVDCSKKNILIVVYTALNNFNYRQVIRLTWGNKKYLDQINATLVFVVGHYPNLLIQLRLEQEAAVHQDILQGEILEDYFLLGYKSLAWMVWSQQYCQVPWLVKTDDDMVNNIWRLGLLVNQLKHHTNSITCYTKTEEVIRHPTGERQDKWVIPFDEYPRKFFPTNCWGILYIMHSSVRDKLLQVHDSGDGKIFRIDDVFITGILAEHANVSHRDIKDLTSTYEDWELENMLISTVWFGHVPADDEELHRKRFWLWRRVIEHEFPAKWTSVARIQPIPLF